MYYVLSRTVRKACVSDVPVYSSFYQETTAPVLLRRCRPFWGQNCSGFIFLTSAAIPPPALAAQNASFPKSPHSKLATLNRVLSTRLICCQQGPAVRCPGRVLRPRSKPSLPCASCVTSGQPLSLSVPLVLSTVERAISRCPPHRDIPRAVWGAAWMAPATGRS